jgi:molybdate transport system substrate-binding protein
MTATIALLSAGAVKPGLLKVIDAFERDSRHKVKTIFATAPEIRKRLRSSEIADVVIAPAELINDFAGENSVFAGDRVCVGRIGVGVMVREDMPSPQISTVESFQQALLNAESIVYNQASTGIYLESLFDKLGIAAQVKSKATRYPDFAAVLDHVRKGNRNEIGLGATTVIIENNGKGIRFVGPLPAEIQNYTSYTAAVVAASVVRNAALELIRYLASPSAKLLFSGAGIE